MNKLVFGIFFCILIFIGIVSAEFRINEVEPNPSGDDSGNEWIELYSDIEVNLSGYILINTDEDEIELNGSFVNYYIVELESQWLDNSDEIIRLKFNESVVDESDLISDSNNDDKTWNYCGEWFFGESSRGSENKCDEDNEGEDEDNSEKDIDIDLIWDEDEIENGKKFDIKVELFNLENEEYDIKVWVENNDEVISEREDDDEWKSGNYYYEKFSSGPGNETEDIKIRIKEEYKDFEGDAEILARIRKNDAPDFIKEIRKDIEILELTVEIEDIDNSNEIDRSNKVDQSSDFNSPISGGVIKLGRKNLKDNEEDGDSVVTESIKMDKFVIYESQNEKMKKYSVLGFALLCLAFGILIMVKKLK